MAAANFPEWISDPIEYLVRIKFPSERAYKASMSISSRSTFTHDPEYLKRAAEFRTELKSLPLSEVRERAMSCSKAETQRAVEKDALEESVRFFNLDHTKTNVEHWSRMSTWLIDEATALSLGRDPRSVTWDKVQPYVLISPFAAIYRDRRDILIRALKAGQLWESTVPGVFLTWAERMRVDIPDNLKSAILTLGVQVADWKTLYDRQIEITDRNTKQCQTMSGKYVSDLNDAAALYKKTVTEFSNTIEQYKNQISLIEESSRNSMDNTSDIQKISSPETGLKTRERDSLLKMVIGMAVKGYAYKPNANRNNAVSEIADDLQKLGISLDPDTVRRYLNEARNLLPPSETE
jgi:hypothetical protein